MSAHLLSDRKTSTALSNREAMIWIPGGSFRMGSNDFYREERPVRGETVQGFWIDPYPVTNADFQKFVSATSYVTTCERAPDPAMYPTTDPSPSLPLARGARLFRVSKAARPRGSARQSGLVGIRSRGGLAASTGSRQQHRGSR